MTLLRNTTRRGFTLLELLVVIAIIGILSAVIFGNINAARENARDAKRISDIRNIQTALEYYIHIHGELPMPASYGEGSDSPHWWDTWWDVSGYDGDGDGNQFLDFLVDEGIFTEVPVDPINTPATNHPNEGYQYIYFIAPQGYPYEGGSCVADTGGAYMLAIRDLETKGLGEVGESCDCIWKNSPNFFAGAFDYLVCGTF